MSPTSTQMRITSPAFLDNETIPQVYTCDGENMSPELLFSNTPEGTKSLVLLMDDPDVPTSIRPDGIFDHWVMYDINPDTKSIATGHFEGHQGLNTSGRIGYTGPCPPDREHRYFFKLYALDRELGLPEGKTKKEIITAMNGHVIAEAVLMGRYNRGK